MPFWATQRCNPFGLQVRISLATPFPLFEASTLKFQYLSGAGVRRLQHGRYL